MGHREGFEQTGLANLSPVYHTYSILFVVISDDSSLPRQSPLSKFLQAVKGEVKKLFLSLLGLQCLEPKIIHRPTGHILRSLLSKAFIRLLLGVQTSVYA